MENTQLRTSVLITLDMTHAPRSSQEKVLARIESIARKRIWSTLPQFLNPEQTAQVNALRAVGRDADAILQWVEQQLPGLYPRLLTTHVKAVASELAEQLHRSELPES